MFFELPPAPPAIVYVETTKVCGPSNPCLIVLEKNEDDRGSGRVENKGGMTLPRPNTNWEVPRELKVCSNGCDNTSDNSVIPDGQVVRVIHYARDSAGKQFILLGWNRGTFRWYIE